MTTLHAVELQRMTRLHRSAALLVLASSVVAAWWVLTGWSDLADPDVRPWWAGILVGWLVALCAAPVLSSTYNSLRRACFTCGLLLAASLALPVVLAFGGIYFWHGPPLLLLLGLMARPSPERLLGTLLVNILGSLVLLGWTVTVMASIVG